MAEGSILPLVDQYLIFLYIHNTIFDYVNGM